MLCFSVWLIHRAIYFNQPCCTDTLMTLFPPLKMSQKQRLRQKLAEKNEEKCMREHNFQLAHQTLEVLSK